MIQALIAAVILLVLAVENAYEFSKVYEVNRGEANLVDIHLRVAEAGELLGFALAGVMLYLAELNVIAVAILAAGPWQLFHLIGALTDKERLSKFPEKTLSRLVKVLMIVTLTEFVVAGSVVVWLASIGWISL